MSSDETSVKVIATGMDGLKNTIRDLASGDYAEQNARLFIDLIKDHDVLTITSQTSSSPLGQSIELGAKGLDGWRRCVTFFKNGIVYIPGQDPLEPQHAGEYPREFAMADIKAIEKEAADEAAARKIN